MKAKEINRYFVLYGLVSMLLEYYYYIDKKHMNKLYFFFLFFPVTSPIKIKSKVRSGWFNTSSLVIMKSSLYPRMSVCIHRGERRILRAQE